MDLWIFVSSTNKKTPCAIIGWLVGGWTNPFEKICSSKWVKTFPNFRGENSKKYLSCHHLDNVKYYFNIGISIKKKAVGSQKNSLKENIDQQLQRIVSTQFKVLGHCCEHIFSEHIYFPNESKMPPNLLHLNIALWKRKNIFHPPSFWGFNMLVFGGGTKWGPNDPYKWISEISPMKYSSYPFHKAIYRGYSLALQTPPVIPCEDRCEFGTPIKAFHLRMRLWPQTPMQTQSIWNKRVYT